MIIDRARRRHPSARLWWHRLAFVLILCALPAGMVWLIREPLGWRLPPVLEPHPAYEYRLRPNQDVRRFGQRVIVNEWGMRSPMFPRERADPREFRVLVFGDSIVAGVGFNDQSALATTLLQERLHSAMGRPVRVGNVAAGSWGPANWLGWARHVGFLGADAVVLVASAHDCDDEPESRAMHPAPRPYPTALVPAVEFAVRQRMRFQRLWVKRHPPKEPPLWTGETRSIPSLRDFLVVARAAVPRVVVVLHPESSELEQPLSGGRAVIANVAAQVGVPVVDAASAYRAASPTVEQLYHDSIHLTDHGQRVLAFVLEHTLHMTLAKRESR